MVLQSWILIFFFNPEIQLKDIESATRIKLISWLYELKSLKFVTTLVSKLQSDNKTLSSSFFSTSKVQTIINEGGIGDVLKSIYSTVISNIQKFLGQGSGWIIDSVILTLLVPVISNYQKN